MDVDEALKGLQIDGYRIEFSKRVALLPVELVTSDLEGESNADKYDERSIDGRRF
jgi:hypothetical protein